jgi:hypothetical protein
MKIKSSVCVVVLLVLFSVISTMTISGGKGFAAVLPECESADMSKDRVGQIWSKPGFDLKQFSTIVVERPGISSLPPSTKLNYDDYADTFHFNLREKLKNSGYFKNVLASQPAADNNTLVLKSEIVEVNPGSTAARWAVGWGAGRGAVGIRSSLMVGGKDVVMCWYGRQVDISSLSGRALIDRAMNSLADRLYQYIDRLYNAGK